MQLIKTYLINTKMLPVILLALCGFWVPDKVFASPGDTLAVLRQFMQVCNSYKQLPLQVSVTVQNWADIVTSPVEDTAICRLEFCLNEKGAYIKMGDNEELINDSLILFIDHKPARMSLFPNKVHNIKEQISQVSGVLLQDSSLQRLSAKYIALSVNDVAPQRGIATIKVTSRATVAGSILPKEIIEIKYREDNKQPVKIVQEHRKIIPLDSATYTGLLSDTLYAGKLVHPGANYWFLIKRAVSTYVFDQVDYDKTKQLPLQVSDCIIKAQAPRAKSRYNPAKAYAAFYLIEYL